MFGIICILHCSQGSQSILWYVVLKIIILCTFAYLLYWIWLYKYDLKKTKQNNFSGSYQVSSPSGQNISWKSIIACVYPIYSYVFILLRVIVTDHDYDNNKWRYTVCSDIIQGGYHRFTALETLISLVFDEYKAIINKSSFFYFTVHIIENNKWLHYQLISLG